MPIEKRIIACTHHKTGSALFVLILRDIANEFNLKLQICEQDALKKDTDIWIQWHSRVNFDNILYPYTGSHIIRDPRDVVVSGYFYHLRCSEKWVLRPQARLNNKSYQEYLNDLPLEAGLLFEMNNTAKLTITQMGNWVYNNPNIIEIKMEDILSKYDEIFDKIFTFYGFTGKNHDLCMKIAREHNAANFSREKIKNSSHIGSLEVGKWRKHFTATHKKEFIRLFGDVLIQLNYEKNNNW